MDNFQEGNTYSGMKTKNMCDYSRLSNVSDDLFANPTRPDMIDNISTEGGTFSKNVSMDEDLSPIAMNTNLSSGRILKSSVDHVSESSSDSEMSVKHFSTPFVKVKNQNIHFDLNTPANPKISNKFVTSVADSVGSDISMVEDSFEETNTSKMPDQSVVHSAKKHLVKSWLSSVSLNSATKPTRQINVNNEDTINVDVEKSDPHFEEKKSMKVTFKEKSPRYPPNKNKLNLVSNKISSIAVDDDESKSGHYNLRRSSRVGKENKKSKTLDFSQLIPKMLGTPNDKEQVNLKKRMAATPLSSQIFTPCNKGIKLRKKKKQEDNNSFGYDDDVSKIMDSVMKLKFETSPSREGKCMNNSNDNGNSSPDMPLDDFQNDFITPKRRLFFRNKLNNSLDDEPTKQDNNVENFTPLIKTRFRDLNALLSNADCEIEKENVQTKKTNKGAKIKGKSSTGSSTKNKSVSPVLPKESCEGKDDQISISEEVVPSEGTDSSNSHHSISGIVTDNMPKCENSFSMDYEDTDVNTKHDCSSDSLTEAELTKSSKHSSNIDLNKSVISSKMSNLNQSKNSFPEEGLNNSKTSNNDSFYLIRHKKKNCNRIFIEESSDEELHESSNNSLKTSYHEPLDSSNRIRDEANSYNGEHSKVSDCDKINSSDYSLKESSQDPNQDLENNKFSNYSERSDRKSSLSEEDFGENISRGSKDVSQNKPLCDSDEESLLVDFEDDVEDLSNHSYKKIQLSNSKNIDVNNSEDKDPDCVKQSVSSDFEEENLSNNADDVCNRPSTEYRVDDPIRNKIKMNVSSPCIKEVSYTKSSLAMDELVGEDTMDKSKGSKLNTTENNRSIIVLSDDDDNFNNIVRAKTPKKNYLNLSDEEKSNVIVIDDDWKRPSNFPGRKKFVDKYNPADLILIENDSEQSDVEITEYGLNDIEEVSSESSDDEKKAFVNNLLAQIPKGKTHDLDSSFALGKKRKVIDVPLPGHSSSPMHTSFLLSLSEGVPLEMCHPDAQKYRDSFSKNKDTLVDLLFKLYNQEIFDNKLPLIEIKWSGRLTTTSGITKSISRITSAGKVRTSGIKLSKTIVDSSWRLRDVLLHEMCHAANWLIDEQSGGHGPLFRKWADKARLRFPEIPKVRICHQYDLKWRHIYRCTYCGHEVGKMKLSLKEYSCGLCGGHVAVV